MCSAFAALESVGVLDDLATTGVRLADVGSNSLPTRVTAVWTELEQS
ncbi:hypothetical protein [Nocardia colli]